MRTASLTRGDSSAQGTFGVFITDSGFSCFSGELPWRNNESGKSCIPVGTYLFKIVNSPKHGKCYEACDDPKTPEFEAVKGRTNIQIHSANYCGDVGQGFKCHLLGCIALGKSVESLEGQKAVCGSKAAMKEFMDDMKGEPFMLEIK